jgi:hypothetical protein
MVWKRIALMKEYMKLLNSSKFWDGRIGVGGVMRDVTENRKKSALQLALSIFRGFFENIFFMSFFEDLMKS